VKIGSQWGIHLSGSFDDNAIYSFKSLIKIPLQDAEIKKISVDFAGVSHVGSSGLSVLLHLLDQAMAVNKEVVLISVNGHIRKVFDVANFNLLFTIR
jgi:anti-anti-sigma factor